MSGAPAPLLRWWLEKNIRRAVVLLASGVVLIVFVFNFGRESSSRLAKTRGVAESFLDRETKNLQLYDYIRINEDMQAAFAKSGLASAQLDNGDERIASWSNSFWDSQESDLGAIGEGLHLTGRTPTLVFRLQHRTLPAVSLSLAIPVLDALLASGAFALGLAFVLFGLCWFFLRKVDRSLALVSSEIEMFAREISNNSGFETGNVRPQDSIFAEIIEMKANFVSLMNRLRDSESKRVAAETSRALTDLAVQVAHDIRSPLSAMKIGLASRGSPETAAELMDSAVARIEKIAADLLNLRKSDVGAQGVLLNSLGNSVSRVLNEAASVHASVKFHLQIFDPVISDRVLALTEPAFERVLSNLLNNSAAVSVVVRVTCTLELHGVNICVQDDGPGIPAVVLTALSDGKSLTTKADGNGLGLLYVKRTLESCGGLFEVGPQGSGGTRIGLLVPFG